MAGEDIILVLRVRAQLDDAIRQLDRLEKETRDADGAASGPDACLPAVSA